MYILPDMGKPSLNHRHNSQESKKMDARWDHSGTWRPACFADPRLQEIMGNAMEITRLLEVYRGIMLASYWGYIRSY